MGFIKNLFKNDSTVIGLCDLRKKTTQNTTYETHAFVLNQLFMEAPEMNVLLQRSI